MELLKVGLVMQVGCIELKKVSKDLPETGPRA